MHLPSVQPLSPALSALLADYETLLPVYMRVAAEEDRLLEVFERDKPRSKAAATAFRGELGLDAATAESDRLGDDLAAVAKTILNTEPVGLPDLVAISSLIRRRNPPDVDGRTTGFYGEIPDFPRHIERIGAALAQAEAADAVVIELAARYEVMAGTEISRLEDEPTSVAEYDRLFDAIADFCPKTLRGLAAMAKTARLRGNDELRETVLGHVENLADLPAGVAMDREEGPAVGSLEAIAREANALTRRADALDAAAGRADQQGRTLVGDALRKEMCFATDQVGQIFARGLDVPARSFVDVLAGIVAIGHTICEIPRGIEDPDALDRLEDIEARLTRYLYGMKGFVERFACVSADDLGGKPSLSSALDPFTNAAIRMQALISWGTSGECEGDAA